MKTETALGQECSCIPVTEGEECLLFWAAREKDSEKEWNEEDRNGWKRPEGESRWKMTTLKTSRTQSRKGEVHAWVQRYMKISDTQICRCVESNKGNSATTTATDFLSHVTRNLSDLYKLTNQKSCVDSGVRSSTLSNQQSCQHVRNRVYMSRCSQNIIMFYTTGQHPNSRSHNKHRGCKHDAWELLKCWFQSHPWSILPHKYIDIIWFNLDFNKPNNLYARFVALENLNIK